MIDNLFRIAGISRYSVEALQRNPDWWSFGKMFAPPAVGIATNVTRDALAVAKYLNRGETEESDFRASDLRSWSYVPFGGRLYNDRWGGSQLRDLQRHRRGLLDTYKDALRADDIEEELNTERRMWSLNDRALELDRDALKPIEDKTLQRIRDQVASE